jgi:hypothetical protein
VANEALVKGVNPNYKIQRKAMANHLCVLAKTSIHEESKHSYSYGTGR